MKEKIHYLIEALLAIAVIILFVFQFSDNRKSSNAGIAASESSGGTMSEFMPIAYVDIDSLMSNYTYSIDLNEQLTKKYENSQANMTERARKLQSEAADFQRKAETNAFLTQERAQSEYDRIMKKQEDLRAYEAQIAQEFNEETVRMSEELRNSIILQLREYNKDKKYQIVYGKRNDNILYADNAYNITAEVIEYLNKHYAVSPVIKPGE